METRAKRLLRALRGEPLWPPPVWLMRQAGRYLPEYRDLRTRVSDFIALCTTPQLAAEATLQPVRRYGFDAAILFSDILMLPRALGYGLEFREGEGPVLPKLHSADCLKGLDAARIPEAIAPILETVRLVRAGLAAEGLADRALIGFAGAPFTVACYMVEGGGSRDFAATRALAYREPQLFERLIRLLTAATITYLAAQIEAGAEAIMLFDSWAGVLSPRLFRSYVVHPTEMIVTRLRSSYPAVPVIGFPRLAGLMVGNYVETTQVDAVGCDTSMDPALVAQCMPQNVAFQGNLDPQALVCGGDVLQCETLSILQALRGRPFVFNLGHGIVPETPPEHVAQLVELVRAA